MGREYRERQKRRQMGVQKSCFQTQSFEGIYQGRPAHTYDCDQILERDVGVKLILVHSLRDVHRDGVQRTQYFGQPNEKRARTRPSRLQGQGNFEFIQRAAQKGFIVTTIAFGVCFRLRFWALHSVLYARQKALLIYRARLGILAQNFQKAREIIIAARLVPKHLEVFVETGDDAIHSRRK